MSGSYSPIKLLVASFTVLVEMTPWLCRSHIAAKAPAVYAYQNSAVFALALFGRAVEKITKTHPIVKALIFIVLLAVLSSGSSYVPSGGDSAVALYSFLSSITDIPLPTGISASVSSAYPAQQRGTLQAVTSDQCSKTPASLFSCWLNWWQHCKPTTLTPSSGGCMAASKT